MASSTKYIRTLRRLIDRHFVIDEVRLLCSDLGIDFDNLSGTTKVVKIDSLLRQIALQGRVVELAELVQEQFPNAISIGDIEALPSPEQQKEDYTELVIESESQESILETYIKNITALLNSVGSGDRKAIKAAAQTYTTTTFPKFDKKHLELAIRFLGDGGCFGEDSIVSLADMDFSGLDLSRANLSRVSLCRTKLVNCKLEHTNLRAADLARVDLTGANLTNANLTGASLSSVEFTNANLSKADFTKVEHLSLIDLTESNANLSGIKLHNIEVDRFNTTTKDDRTQRRHSYHVKRNLDLSGLDLTSSQFTDIDLWELNLTGANLTKCFFGQDFQPLKVIFNEADLSYAEFHGCAGNGGYGEIYAKFVNAKLHRTRFLKSNKTARKSDGSDTSTECKITMSRLEGADFRNADLLGFHKEISFDPQGVKLDSYTKLRPSWRLSHQLVHQGVNEQNLRSVNLSYTTLIELNFSKKDLSRSDFTGTNLERSKFVGASLVNAIFVSATLSDTDFTNADLRNANLKGVDFNFCLTNARLDGANLREANLDNVDFSKVTIIGAIYDQYTSWPDGFDPAAARARFIETKDE